MLQGRSGKDEKNVLSTSKRNIFVLIHYFSKGQLPRCRNVLTFRRTLAQDISESVVLCTKTCVLSLRRHCGARGLRARAAAVRAGALPGERGRRRRARHPRKGAAGLSGADAGMQPRHIH